LDSLVKAIFNGKLLFSQFMLRYRCILFIYCRKSATESRDVH